MTSRDTSISSQCHTQLGPGGRFISLLHRTRSLKRKFIQAHFFRSLPTQMEQGWIIKGLHGSQYSTWGVLLQRVSTALRDTPLFQSCRYQGLQIERPKYRAINTTRPRCEFFSANFEVLLIIDTYQNMSIPDVGVSCVSRCVFSRTTFGCMEFKSGKSAALPENT